MSKPLSRTFVSGLTNTLIILAVLSLMSYYAYSAFFYNGVQDTRATLDKRDFNDKITTVNASIISLVEAAIASLGTVLTDVHSGTNTFVTRDPGGLSVTVDAFTINGIVASNASRRINVLGGVGINVVTGATDITVSTPAILSISGVFPANTTGDVNFVGTGMIDVIPFANSSTVQVDGSAIVTTLTTLQNMDIMQEAQIMNISSIVSSLQTQVNSVQMAGDMVAQALNGTVITFNMTLVELITEVMQAQAAIAALQAQLANFTTTAVPTGSVFAWGGSAMGPYPSGYLLCDGASYPTTSFPELFGIIANMYGGSMGFFNVPDLRGKVVAGKGGSVLNVVVGTSVGTETHTLTTAEMPAHNHHNNIVPSPPPANGDTGGVAAHKHELPKYRATVSISGGQPVGASPAPPGTCMSGTGLAIDNCVGATNYEQPILLTATPGDPDAQTSEENAHTHTIAPNGQSNAHPNIQPTLVMQYIIKT